MSSSQAKSPRHRAGAGFSSLLREILREGRGSCAEVRVVGLHVVETHQFSGEASTSSHLSKPMETT